jgi:hypothetical protein
MPVGELLRAQRIQPAEDRGQRRLSVEPAADLAVERVQHRWPFRHRLAAAIGAPVCRPLLARAPGRLQV